MTAETYSGKPCAHGHTLRYRSNRKCVACATVPARYVVFQNGQMVSYHESLADALWHGDDVWLARRVPR